MRNMRIMTALALLFFGTTAAAVQNSPIPAEILGAEPFDRLTLIDGTVVNVEPLAPRPLPPYDPKKDRKASEKPAIPPEGNILLPSQKAEIEAAARAKRERDPQLNELTVKPIDRDGLFRVRRASIKTIEYFEDLLLAEGDDYLRRRDYPRAFERYLAVKERAPNWSGLEAHVQRLLFEEGAAALLDLDLDRGLRLLRDLHAANPNYPGLADVLAKAFSGRIDRAFDTSAYVEGRRVLRELDQLAPDHPVLKASRDRYIAKARGLAEHAAKSQGYERLDALTEALRVWPRLEGVGERYAEAFRLSPTLDVAVVDVAREIGPWVRSPADDRITRLLYRPLLIDEDEDSLQGRHEDQLSAGLETADLGRRWTIAIRAGLKWSDGGSSVTAFDAVRSLADRANPHSPAYQARWGSLLERLEAPDERQMIVTLARPTLKPAGWLIGPVGPAIAGRDGRVAVVGAAPRLVTDGPFTVAAETTDDTAFLAVNPKATPIARIRERSFPDAAAAIAALRRGDVTVIEELPHDQRAGVSADPEIQVGRYAQPRIHLLALDGRTPALRNRSLRRGISYAINRKLILEENLLKRPVDAENGPSDGVFGRGSYANVPQVKPLETDPLLARMLVAAARREMGGTPIRLTLEVPKRHDALIAVPKIAEALRGAGLEIEVIERPESELEAGIRGGRPFDLAYRVLVAADPITHAGTLICPGFDAPSQANPLGSIVSPRTLELLLQLENASQFPIARGLVIQLDREVRDELPVIPLWELQHHYAWRTRLKGPDAAPSRLYQDVNHWEIAPWFAREP